MKQLALLLFSAMLMTSCGQQNKSSAEPWTKVQMMAPAKLAQKIEANQVDDMLILSIGFDDIIKGSIDLGPANDSTQLAALKDYLKTIPKDQSLVLYCGCCPLEKCPNVRPAFQLINAMGFTNAKLLNIETSIKANWLDKGYPAKALNQ